MTPGKIVPKTLKPRSVRIGMMGLGVHTAWEVWLSCMMYIYMYTNLWTYGYPPVYISITVKTWEYHIVSNDYGYPLNSLIFIFIPLICRDALW